MSVLTTDALPSALLLGVVTATGIIVGALLGAFAPLSHRAIVRAMSLVPGCFLLQPR